MFLCFHANMTALSLTHEHKALTSKTYFPLSRSIPSELRLEIFRILYFLSLALNEFILVRHNTNRDRSLKPSCHIPFCNAASVLSQRALLWIFSYPECIVITSFVFTLVVKRTLDWVIGKPQQEA